MRFFYNDNSSSMSRRPHVNIVGPFDDDDQPDNRKFCPRSTCGGIGLIWREDLNSWYCTRCGYTPPPAPAPRETTSPSSSNSDKPRLKNGKHDDISIDDSGVYVKPVSKSRSEEQEEYLKRKRFAGLDKDTDMLQSKGYNIIASDEHTPNADHTTISSEDLKREKERRRTKGRW